MRVRRALAAAVLTSVATAAATSTLMLLGACTSGTTPNCGGDAAGTCDPYEAGSDSGPADGAADAADSSLHGG